MKYNLSFWGVMTIGLCNTNLVDAQSAARPNVLLIMTDDLGWGDISCYGAPDTKTPNIDQLANDGVRMTNFHASAAVSSPSRAALLTGCFPQMVGVQGVIRHRRSRNYGNLKDNVPTIANSFKAGGYHTCLLGKWHLGLSSPDLPNDRGFDEFKGLLAGSVSDNYEHKLDNINFMRENRNEITTSGVHITDLITDWSIDYLNDRANKKNPFFLFLSYTAPHTPIQPTQESLQRVLEREKGIDHDRAKYVALIEHVDESIGRVVRTLKETNQMENTIIIFISDNGGELKSKANNGPYKLGKGYLWEGGLKVPFIVHNPQFVKKHLEPGNLMTTMDIFPTLLDLVGLQNQIPSSINGVSFADLFRGRKFTDPERTLFFISRDAGKRWAIDYRAIIFNGWKALQNSPTEEFQFIHLDKDEFESHPLRVEQISNSLYNKFRLLNIDHESEVGAIPWQRER